MTTRACDNTGFLVLTALVTGFANASAVAAPAARSEQAKIEKWSARFNGGQTPDKRHWSVEQGAGTSSRAEGDSLRITDSAAKPGSMNLVRSELWTASGREAVVEAQVRVNASSGRGGALLLIADGAHEEGLDLYPDQVRGLHGSWSIPLTGGADAFHTYRVSVAGTRLRLWIDDKLVRDDPRGFTFPAHLGRNQVSFGAGASAETSESAWKSVCMKATPMPETKTIPGGQNVVIYKQEGVYACFPDLTRTADGLLYSKFATRVKNGNSPHADPTGGNATFVSRDGGETWQPAANYPGDDTLNRRPDGSVAFVAGRGWVEIPAEQRDSYTHKGYFTIPVRSGVAAYLGGAYSVLQKPGEKEMRRPVPGTDDASLMYYGKTLKTRSGVRMTPIYGNLTRPYAPAGKTGGWETSYAVRSEDDGTTWKMIPIAAPALQADGSTIGFNETTIAELPDGRLVALMRPSPDSIGHLYQSESRDQGITWSAPIKTPMWGYPAHLLVLKSGELLASYGYRRAPMGIRACISRDGGKAWDIENEIILRADGAVSGSDLGYPQTAQNADGTLVTVYYLTTSERITHVAATRWKSPAPESRKETVQNR